MTSKTTYCASAVAAAVVFVVAVLPLGRPFESQGVVLAEVIKRTEAVKTLTHREKRVAYRLGEESPVGEAVTFRQASSELGIVDRQYDTDGNLMLTAYILKKDPRLLIVFPQGKVYVEVPLGDDAVALMEDFSPKGFVKLLTRNGYTKLDPTESEGRTIEGFEMSMTQVQDLLSIYNCENYGHVFPVKELTVRLFVDVETSLPVRTETEFTTGSGLLTGFKELRCQFETYDIQWGVEIDPQDFVPNIPEDYKRIDLDTQARPAPDLDQVGEAQEVCRARMSEGESNHDH